MRRLFAGRVALSGSQEAPKSNRCVATQLFAGEIQKQASKFANLTATERRTMIAKVAAGSGQERGHNIPPMRPPLTRSSEASWRTGL